MNIKINVKPTKQILFLISFYNPISFLNVNIVNDKFFPQNHCKCLEI